MENLKGIYSALLVPFDKEGNILEDGLREIINHNINVNKIDGLYVNGSSGENFSLNTSQKKRVFEITKEEVGNRIKLIAQIGSLDLNESVELAKFTTDLGYDAISAVVPFYYKISFKEIKHYYETIINATDNKMILYYIPSLTGVKITLDQFAELMDNEKVIGIKYTDANFYMLERFRKRFPNKIIWSGFDEMLVQAAVTGVDGAIGSTNNIHGMISKKIFSLVQEEKIKEAYELQHRVNDVIEKMLEYGLYQSLKEILKIKGINAGYCKQPKGELDEEKIALIKKLVQDYNL